MKGKNSLGKLFIISISAILEREKLIAEGASVSTFTFEEAWMARLAWTHERQLQLISGGSNSMLLTSEVSASVSFPSLIH